MNNELLLSIINEIFVREQLPIFVQEILKIGVITSIFLCLIGVFIFLFSYILYKRAYDYEYSFGIRLLIYLMGFFPGMVMFLHNLWVLMRILHAPRVYLLLELRKLINL
jgi:hypothetical protein